MMMDGKFRCMLRTRAAERMQVEVGAEGPIAIVLAVARKQERMHLASALAVEPQFFSIFIFAQQIWQRVAFSSETAATP
jgi:hypothetical protein